MHRTHSFPRLVRVSGLVTTHVAAGVVDSWPLCAGRDQRTAAITAVRTRLVTPAELDDELVRHPRMTGRRDLGELVHLLAGGCESGLEIRGHLEVIRGPGLDHGVRQHHVPANGTRYRIDLACLEERVAVEMDGDHWRSTPAQRERDRRRDAAPAAAGWVTLRFSHRRLQDDAEGCRRDTRATVPRRRRP